MTEALVNLDQGEFAPWAGLLPGQGMWLPDDLPAESYHRIALPSNSKLGVLLRSPFEYFVRYEAPLEQRLPEEHSKAMRLGTLVHCAVLEPQRWERTYCVAPEKVAKPEKPDLSHLGSPSCKAYRAALAEWREQADAVVAELEAERAALIAGRTIIDRDEYELVVGMCEAIAGHPIASRLLSGGARERSMVWRDAETGILLRARVDLDDEDNLVDLKSTNAPDPEGFTRACLRYGYHRQDACYGDGVLAVTGKRRRFGFVVVHNERPHEVGIYELGNMERELGRRQYRAALADLKCRRETKNWRASWELQPHTLEFPGWAFRGQEWTDGE